MKRLFGLLLVFVVFFSFSAKPTFGQATSGTETYDYFKGIIDNHHTEAYTTLAGFVSSGGVAAQAAGDYRTFITKAKEAYDTAFSQARASGARPVDAQLLGIRAWVTSTQDPANFTPVRRYGISSPSNTVYSQLSRKMSDASLSAERIKRGNIEAGSGEDTVATAGGTIATAGTTNKNETVIVNERKCSAGVVSCFISESVQWIIKNTLMQFAGFLLWITSNMFSYVIQVGILDFKKWASDALYPIWAVVRQIVSLGVVFVGLYLGFMYILGREDKFARYIPWVLMFALFVNFSYPVARFAVDVSNIVSLNVYAAAFSNEALNGTSNASAGAVIMNRLGLQQLAMAATTVENSATAATNLIKGINSVPAALLVVVFILYAAYIFFMATAILAIRTAALVFLTIASPFLFIDSVLPVLGDRAQQIRKIFFEQLAVAPVFMLLIALTTKFMLVFSKGPLKAGGSSLPSDGASIAVFFNILMMIIMLHITLKVTKSVAGTLGQYATDAMGKVGGVAMGAATGGAGLLARNSLGRLAMKARDSKWMQTNQDSAVGRRLYDMSNSFAKSSFDLRNSSVVAGGMQKAGMGMGQGRTAGYEEAMEARRKDILERGSRIKTRYERDVVDKDGNILHRQGDVDKEAQAAYDRYIAQGGGSVFMSQEQKQLAKEALGKQAGERSDKNIAEAKKNADGDLSLYNSEKDPAEKERFVLELKRDLEKLKEADADLEGIQAQSIRRTLNAIEAQKRAQAEEFANSVQDSLERYTNTKGSTPEKEQENKERLLNAISDLKVRAAVMQKLGIKGADTPSKQDDNEFIDLTEPNTPEGTRAARLQEAAERAQREMSQNASVRNEKTNTPEAVNNSVPFAVAAQEKFDPKLQNIAQMFAEARAAAAINKAQESSRGGSAGPEPSKQSAPPRAPAPQSGAVDIAI